jgi:hypothetical protein
MYCAKGSPQYLPLTAIDTLRTVSSTHPSKTPSRRFSSDDLMPWGSEQEGPDANDHKLMDARYRTIGRVGCGLSKGQNMDAFVGAEATTQQPMESRV